jgi:hypothetical protein
MSNAIGNLVGVVLIVCIIGVTGAILYHIECEGWPWEPVVREQRARNRRFKKRVAMAMRHGMTAADAESLVEEEIQKESAAARKAYQEAGLGKEP